LNHSSHTVAAFDEQQITTHLLQTMSRDQTGNARAYDDRINIHLVCSGTPAQYRRQPWSLCGTEYPNQLSR
jgi:hypothetical protein